MSYYNEVNPPSVYYEECPCANSEEGFSPRCSRSDHWEEHDLEQLLQVPETALFDDDQFDADVSLIVDYELSKLR